MFDFHIHVTPSGSGGLLPAEALRLAKCAGLRGVGLILRGDSATIRTALPELRSLVKTCSLYAGIEAFAGVELVHMPPALLPDAVTEARELGAALVLVHGETIPRDMVDVVELGTNLAAIEAGADILAHPGLITPEDTLRAAEKGVFLELNLAPRHALANGHIANMARQHGASLVLASDAHTRQDFTSAEATQLLYKAAARGAGLDADERAALDRNARQLMQRLLCG